MEELSKYFDHYTINSRFKPAFFSVLPFVLTMFAWCPIANTVLGGTLTILISFGVMAFISSLISDLGNKIQDRLFHEWGGAPTTIILRYSDRLLDKYTKERYHKWLGNKIPNLTVPTVAQETNDPDDADQAYLSATNFLREYTRDKNIYPRVYNDNVAYGFARNLLAIRKFGLFVAIISTAINAYYLVESLLLGTDSVAINIPGIGAGMISIVFVMIFLLIVNNAFVKTRAFRYAKTLLEVSEVT